MSEEPGDQYCDLCDLPRATCVHGMATPPPAPAARTARTTPAKATPVRRRTAAPSSGSASTVRRPARRRTAQADFKPWIVTVLQEAGGEQASDDVLATLEERLADHLLPGDRETGPTGEVRWRTAARFARKELADDGLLLAPQPGVWALTPRGLAEPGLG
ncbi:winged helix-turn-helix domain-containing protein [Nocardioides acrostichi]|uniref:Winged helix-turn-helix domain-containing protein n=1 Tax=Nocardioides acrostichi TaxID=2784339 RepID=A0A930UVM7_9ACTN|nr:winged helix-turn-helix domain-containing protein [Nocardioides acrostichi]MBF4161698.1 winged helix-turn-helix domain-containing protein [Nocardioides acrostichi]